VNMNCYRRQARLGRDVHPSELHVRFAGRSLAGFSRVTTALVENIANRRVHGRAVLICRDGNQFCMQPLNEPRGRTGRG
jgi:hypothetical protein